jgi:tetratricopeptide (TPR) repeat protein
MVGHLKPLVFLAAMVLLIAHATQGKAASAQDQADAAASRLAQLNQEALESQRMADYATALALVDSALTLANELGDRTAAMVARNTGAITYLRMGRLTEALAWQQAAIDMATVIDDKWKLGIGHNNLGTILRMQGDYAGALEHHLLAQRISRESGDSTTLSGSIVNTGHVHYFMNDMDAALAAYTKAHPICDALGDHKCVMILEVSRGNIHLSAERYPEAMEHYTKALELEQLVGNRSLAADILNNIGLAHQGAGDLRKAIDAHERSLAVKTEVGDLVGMGNSHKNLGVLHASIGAVDKAEHHYMECIRIAREAGSKYLLAGSYEELSALEAGRGQYRMALEHYKQYVLYKDSMLNESTAQRIEEMKVAYETAEREAAIELLERDNALVRAELVARRNTQRLQAVGFSLVLLLGGSLSAFLIYRRRQRLVVRNTRLELALVKAQMKPHFIFNALTSAHAALGKVDEQAADHLLSLARHMRSVLNGSLKDEVDLVTEVQHWEEYLALEKRALPGGFEHRIDIAADIDTQELRVPSMLLQPILENAIWHGVALRSADRLLQVHVERADGRLRMRVVDNGPGQHALHQGGRSRHPGAPGVGLKLISDRIKAHYGMGRGMEPITIRYGNEGTWVDLVLPLQGWDE